MNEKVVPLKGNISKKIDELETKINNLGIYSVKEFKKIREDSGPILQSQEIRIDSLINLLIKDGVIKEDELDKIMENENINFHNRIEEQFDKENHLFLTDKPIAEGFFAEITMSISPTLEEGSEEKLAKVNPQTFMVNVGSDLNFPKAVHDSLIGMIIGEKKKTKLIVPKEFYNTETEKEVEIEVTINKIKEQISPQGPVAS